MVMSLEGCVGSVNDQQQSVSSFGHLFFLVVRDAFGGHIHELQFFFYLIMKHCCTWYHRQSLRQPWSVSDDY